MVQGGAKNDTQVSGRVPRPVVVPLHEIGDRRGGVGFKGGGGEDKLLAF